jgi:DNA polymerase
MDDALADAASRGEDLVIELPSGRSLRYENVKREYRTFSDPDEPEVKQRRVVLTAVVGGIRSIFYGGLIVENITQAVARDVFAHNVLLLVDAGIQVIWTVHDEAVCAVKDEAEAEKARRIMATVPPWLEGCPIDAEVVISDRYTK